MLNASQMAGCWRTRRFLFPLEEGAKGIPGIAWAKARQPESQAALVASQAAPSGCRGACGLVPVPLSSASEATFPECFLLSMFSFMTDVILTQRKPGWAALHPEYPQDPLPPSQNTRAFTVLTPGVPHKSQTAAVQGRCVLPLMPGTCHTPRALMKMQILGRKQLFVLVTFSDLSPSPEWLALSHAVRIRFSHPPAVI